MTSATLTRSTAYRRVVAEDTRPIAVFLYRRISRDPEGLQLGVQRQDEDLHEWVERAYSGAEVLDGQTPEHPEGYCDNDRGASTRSRKPRPNYDRLMRDAQDAATSGRYRKVIVAAYTSSRLTRRPREHEDLIELAERDGVEYHFLKSPSFDLNTAAGRQIARMLAAQDAGEAETSAERILRAKEQQAVDGVYSGGGRPFGYRIEYDYNANGLPIKPGRLVLDEREAAAIRDGVRTFLAGTTLRALAKTWTAAGFTTGSGHAWTPTSVRRVLERGRNAGLSERNGELVGKGQWPAIVTEDELAAVRVKLSDPSRKSHHGDYSRKWLGSKLYRCGQPGCTSDMRSSGGNKGGAPRYCCREHGHCVIDADVVDAFVRGEIAVLVEKDGSSLVDNRSTEADRLDHEARVIEGKIAALDSEYDGGNGELTLRAYAVQSRKLEEQLAAIEDHRATLIVPSTVLVGIEKGEDFLDAPLERQRAIVDALVTVTVTPGRRGRQPAGAKITDRVLIVPKTTAG
jgi:site-specific DNA recombinase